VPYWDTEDEQNAGPSREVSNSRMSNLQRDIERLELGRQSDNEFYSKKLSNIDNKMTSMEGDMAEVQGRLTRAESLQEQNTRQISDVLSAVHKMGSNVNIFMEASTKRFEDRDLQERENRERWSHMPDFVYSAIANSRSANPAYSPAQLHEPTRYSLSNHISPRPSYQPQQGPQRTHQPGYYMPDHTDTNWMESHDDEYRGGASGATRQPRRDMSGPAMRGIAGPSTIPDYIPQHMGRLAPAGSDLDPALEDFAVQYLNDYPTGPSLGDSMLGLPGRQLPPVPQLKVQPPSQSTTDSSSRPTSPSGLLPPEETHRRTSAPNSEDGMKLLAQIAGESSPLLGQSLTRQLAASPSSIPDDDMNLDSEGPPEEPGTNESTAAVTNQSEEPNADSRIGEASSNAATELLNAQIITPVDNPVQSSVAQSRAPSRQRSAGPSSSVTTRSASRSREASLQPVGRRTRSASVSSGNGALGRG